MPQREAVGSALSLAVLRGLCAGVGLGSIELLLVVALDRRLFLTGSEIARYLAAALLCVPFFVTLAALGCAIVPAAAGALRGGRALEPRLLGLLAGSASLPLAWTLLSELGSGRRLRALADQGWPVALLALVVALATGLLVRVIVVRARARTPARGMVVALSIVSVTSMVLDAQLLRRLYPALHAALACGSVASALLVSYLLVRSASAQAVRAGWSMLGLLALAQPFAYARAMNVASVQTAIELAAPLTGKLAFGMAALAPRAAPPAPSAQHATAGPPSDEQKGGVGLDLRGHDVLLITVDALRADRLRAYGGSGLTPELDALAAQSRVFLRAYTPTPHTSYAVASLMTGKPLFLLRALSEDLRSHVSLPELLRRHGYRTAAFYPPAIFYVDSERFAPLAERHLGFEYVKAMYADAALRPRQLRAYLREVAEGHPVFAWVHLFEPHEPYDPDPRFLRGDSPVERYDGEVAAADAAVGELVRTFRAARPSSIVIVSADHGEEFGDHGGHHHGTTLFDEQVRVPLVWSTPGRVEPGTSDAPCELYDVPTTLLSVLGIPRDVRMRGDDLSPLLARAPGSETSTAAPEHAFAAIDGSHMTTDGRFKHVCATRSGACQLFDLERDPEERVDVAEAHPERVKALQAAWDALIASLPRIEALDLSGRAFPEALARARLFDHGVAPQLIGLLSSPRAEVRAEAAAALAELGVEQATTVLASLLERETDAEARAHMAIAALRLGHQAATPHVEALLVATPISLRTRRLAALALASAGSNAGNAVLIEQIADESLAEPERVAAIRALASVRDARAARPLIELLPEVRLRAEAALALGAIGGRAAIGALTKALATERYPEARTAEARALLALGQKARMGALVREHLARASGVPDGLGLLQQAGQLVPHGLEPQRAPSGSVTGFDHAGQGSTPRQGARLVLPVRGRQDPDKPGEIQLVLRATAHAEPARLSVRLVTAADADARADARAPAPSGTVLPEPTELSFTLAPSSTARPRTIELELETSAPVWIEAALAQPARKDLPPPAPTEPEPTLEEPSPALSDQGSTPLR